MIGQCHLKKSGRLDCSIVGDPAGRRNLKLLPVYRYFVLVHKGDDGWCIDPEDSQSLTSSLLETYFWYDSK
jgi:hypothetical protein